MNVLFLMVDEMTWWALDAGVHTLNLDQLAARGLRFDAAYTPSPICVPTRACVATGKYLHEIGYWSSAEAYDGLVPSWAHAVRDAGIDCVSFGKLHFRNGQDDTGFSRQIEPIHVPGGAGWVRGLLRKPLCDYTPTAEMAEQIGAGNTDYQEFDRRVANATCDWLSDHARQAAPWCAFVSFVSPHYPLIAPEQDFALYDPRDYEAEAQSVPDHPILQETAGFFDHDPYFTPETRGIAHAGYRGLCTFVDRQIGKVLDALEVSGMAGDTLILFASDHGDMMGEHGFWSKSTMYEASARVPLILAGPGIEPGRRTDPVSLIDTAPTIAQAFGLSQRLYSGKPLTEAPVGGRTVLSEYHDGGASVGITMVRWTDEAGAWKYVHFAEGNPPQLFELISDPDEQRNLAGANLEKLAEARQRLNRWMDPEVTNTRAHTDQAAVIDRLGGRAVLEAEPQWNFTPADSR